MGTSSSFKGPKNKTPLLPSWAPPPPNIESKESNQTEAGGDSDRQPDAVPIPGIPLPETVPLVSGSWRTAKGQMTRYVKTGDRTALRKAGQAYVKALGGKSGASRSAISGHAGLASFGGFLGNVVRNGINTTLTKYNLSQFIGHTAEETLAAIIDQIAPSGATNEEAITRKAMLETMEYLYSIMDLENQGISALDAMPEDKIRDCMIYCVSAYIYERWLNQLSLAIEEKTISESEAVYLEKDVKDYVFEMVKTDLSSIDVLNRDFNEEESKNIIENIFETAYSTLK